MPWLPDPRERPWLTVAELAAVTGEGEKAIRAAVASGQLPVIRIGRYVRIPTAPLYALLGIDPDMTAEAPPGPRATALDSTAKEVAHAQDTAAQVRQRSAPQWQSNGSGAQRDVLGH